MIKLDSKTKQQLIKLGEEKHLFLEGEILKNIDSESDAQFESYIKKCIERYDKMLQDDVNDKEKIKKQNQELKRIQEEIERVNEELLTSLKDAEEAKKTAEDDLDLLQKKNQYEMINNIVYGALTVIIGIGIVTTLLYIFAILVGKETQIIGSTWSNLLGILLTNAFSIVGTIMGVKYGNEKNENQSTSK